MPKSYKITYVDKFNSSSIQESTILFEAQMYLPDVPPGPQTEIRKARDKIKILDFTKYIILHEMEENVYGRISNQSFHKYIRKETIFAYHSESESLFLLSGKKKFVIDFCKKTKDSNDILISTINVNMSSLLTKLPSVKGVWFRFSNGLIRASALMGSNIDSTMDFQKYKSVGDISTLSFLYEFGEVLHSIMVTNDGAIVLYENYKEISDEIEIILDIDKNLLKDIYTKVSI